MSLSYIREYYGVPAKVGEPVIVISGNHKGKKGFVTGSSGPHVRVKLAWEKRSKIYHPTDLEWVNMGVI